MTKEETIRNEFDKKIRNDFITNHPFCQYCGKKAEHVHHIIPIASGGDNRENNLISLCMECHGLIHHKHYNENWRQLQKEGIERAKAEGRFKGGQPKIKPDNWRENFLLWKTRGITKVALAQKLGVSRPTLDKWIKEELELINGTK